MSRLDESEALRVAIYTRVSTEEQARGGYSLDDQLDKLRGYVGLRDHWSIAGEYVDDGYTGRNIRRPAYTKMLEEIKNWDAILVMKMDRIHRKVSNALKMFEDIKKKEKHFISFTENIDTSTAGGRAMMTITLVFAQLESEQIGERVFSGQSQKAKQGETFMGHKTAFGYTWTPPDEKEEKEGFFTNDQKELDLVKCVFQMYIDGFSMRKIAKKLSPDYKKLHPKHKDLANTTVKYFLHNCMYAGVERWCNHFWNAKAYGLDPLISVETFNKVQILMRERCHSHVSYEPMLIEDVQKFKIDLKKVKLIPVINRAKHNYNF